MTSLDLGPHDLGGKIMTKYMIISMQSGEKHIIKLDDNEANPDDTAHDFWKAIDFRQTTSLRWKDKIIIMKYVEAFTFVEELDAESGAP